MNHVNRISHRLSSLKQHGKTALIPYITAGDPYPDLTVEIMHLLVDEGADLIELGVPFSDPMADGPVIQKAVERALAHQVSLKQVLSMVSRFREQDKLTPVILMGYLNPVEAMGFENFARYAQEAGVDGVLTVDMPPEESEGYAEALELHELERIFLVSPTTPESRLTAVNHLGSGFVYYVSLKGVTGKGTLDASDVASHVTQLRAKVNLPVGIGFGIRDADSAYTMAKLGDAVIIGSALVSQVEKHFGDPSATKQALVEQMRIFKQAIARADQGDK
ncbi:tryptophan synthase subunit alpha [Thiomicrospira microaerophila]|uniref:tryptophan synthase subunit alpha n=1 Tax=Thiomicrospira microaerophila TaxID=406020 RepID=UPI00200EE669|nr:tryptophan synthase subunit alpha [Thiomicrospira microaerophila]UQB42851.1 tryptophan synthase subunit alpha [Thiomicrospira microaerophila]